MLYLYTNTASNAEVIMSSAELRAEADGDWLREYRWSLCGGDLKSETNPVQQQTR